MTTSIDRVIPGLDPQGNVSSLRFEGTSNRARVSLTITSTANVALFAEGQSLVDPTSGAWDVDFVLGEDFFDGDISCGDVLDANIEYLDRSWLPEDDYPKQVTVDCDACSITIDTISAVSASGSGEVVSITVAGTASPCPSVVVSLSVPGGTPISNSVSVSNGAWQTSFVADAGSNLSLKDFNCGDDIIVAVECKDDGDCRTERTLSLPCRTACPTFVDVSIRNDSGSLQITNPQPSDLQCLPAGRYRLAVTSPAASAVISYAWFRNQDETNSIGTGRELAITLAASESVSYSVSVQQTDGCQPGRTLSFACGNTNPPPPPPPGGGDTGGGDDDDDDDDDTGGGGGGGGQRAVCDMCCYWFIANIIGTFATLVAFAIAGCAFQWLEPISITVAVSLAVAVTISWIAWAIVCRTQSGNSCRPIRRWLNILDVLSILAGLVAVAVGVSSPCAIAFWVNVGFLQNIRICLTVLAQCNGCLPNPWPWNCRFF